MTTFPALVPSSRTFTPGEYPATAFNGYSGAQNRVRHSNVFLAAQLRLTFLGLTQAQMLDIWNHYNGRRGEFRSFDLPAEIVSFGSITDYVPGNYLWRYAGPGSVEDLPCGGHNVSLTLETVPPTAASVVGVDLFVRMRLTAGVAAGGEFVPGINETVTLSIDAGAAFVALNGINETITLSLETGEVFGDVSVPGVNEFIYISFATQPAVNSGAPGINETITLSLSPGSASDGLAWTPAEISTALWLDASDSLTITQSGGVVSQWNDKSGNARTASQSTTGNRPALSTGAQNGLDALSFDGFNDFFSLASSLPLASSGSFEVFFAGRPDWAVSTDATWMGAGIVRQYPGSDAAGSWAIGIRRPGIPAVNHHLTSGTNANGSIGGGSLTANTNAIVSWRYNTADGSTSAAQWEMRINAGSPVTETASSTSSGWSVGNGEIGRAFPSGAWCYLGLMFEIVIASSALSSADRERVEGYLAHKWGLTANLPSGHPYKSSAP